MLKLYVEVITLLTVIIGDCDSRSVDFANLCAALGIKQLYFEVLVLFRGHVVDDWNLEVNLHLG